MSGFAWKIVAGGSAGAAHAERGSSSSDAWRAELREERLSLVVADGLGSSSGAAAAAHVAVAAAARCLAAAPAPDSASPAALEAERRTVLAAVASARAALDVLSLAATIPPRELGTTLLVATAIPGGCAFGGVGDGFLTLRTPEDAGVCHHLLRLEGDAELANATPTLLNGEPKAWAIADRGVNGLLLATDGIEPAAIADPAGPMARLRPGVVDALLAHADDASDSGRLHVDLQQPAWDAGSTDDRTVVMAVRS